MKLSDANVSDFAEIAHRIKNSASSDSLEGAAQAFADAVYDPFRDSFVLLRLFTSLPYSALPPADQELVDKKARDSGNAHLVTPRTPVLTLLGTRGQEPDWNERSRSQGFRCIPLLSSGYVSSLSMLSMQFLSMDFDLALLDDWEAACAEGRIGRHRGMLFVQDAAVDKDELGRMAVPRQDFVSRYGVKTALGFGDGYSDHPTMVTLFAFTSESLDQAQTAFLGRLLEEYVSVTRDHVKAGPVFTG